MPEVARSKSESYYVNKLTNRVAEKGASKKREGWMSVFVVEQNTRLKSRVAELRDYLSFQFPKSATAHA